MHKSKFRQNVVFVAMIIFHMTEKTFANVSCPSRPDPAQVIKKSRSHDLFFVDAKRGRDEWNGKTHYPRIYFVTETITLDERDKRLSIVGYPGDRRPLISGAYRIPGSRFTPLGQKIFAAPIEGKCSKHVFLGDKRLVRARKPNLKRWTGNDMTGEGPYLRISDLLRPTSKCNIEGIGGFKQDYCHPDNQHGFVFKEGDIDLRWRHPETGDILVFHAWTAERGHILNITARKNQVHFVRPLKHPIGMHPNPSGWRYIVENVFEELDATGEFFCDETNKRLYLIPPERSLTSKSVFIASVDILFIVKNTADIQFLDLAFRHSNERNVERYHAKPSLLQFEDTSHVVIERCEFSNIGHTAITLDGTCINHRISANKFHDIGYYGVHTGYQTRNFLIRKNTFTSCGVSHMFQPSCVHVQGAANAKVVENKISFSPYAGIKVGWQPMFRSSYLRPNRFVFIIEKNDVSNYGMGILSDFGGIYLASNPKCSGPRVDLSECHLHARVSLNTVHRASAYHYGGMGIYGDTAVSSLRVEKNWLYDLDGAAINFHCGQNNLALNNMVYHTNGHHDLTFKKNVIYVANSAARMWRSSDEWVFAVPQVNNNIYFFRMFHQHQVDEFFPKHRSLQEWRNSTSNDLRSVISDPLFQDVAHRDFRLRSKSVGSRIGIKIHGYWIQPFVGAKSREAEFVHTDVVQNTPIHFSWNGDGSYTESGDYYFKRQSSVLKGNRTEVEQVGLNVDLESKTINNKKVKLKQNYILSNVTNTDARLWRNPDRWNYEIPDVDYNDYYFDPSDETQMEEFFPSTVQGAGVSFEHWRKETGNGFYSITEDQFSIQKEDVMLTDATASVYAF
ncbi:unnamed protein product [Clavelina lepadiformis]|uniref:Right handed beta helix domain-containing protein n=1 Tax=Clavelina lepadiformis TaxID=159417 RepID=A0ABP0F5S4_CLALP